MGMHRHRRSTLLVAVALTALFTTSCAESEAPPLAPLAGANLLNSGQAGVVNDDDIEVLSDAVDISLDDLPDGMFERVPGFGERPLDELDLPPDVPPPPIEDAPPSAPVTQPPSTTTSTPARTSSPQGGLDPAAVAAVNDFCTLFHQYGNAWTVVDQAIVSGSPSMLADSLRFAIAVYSRAAELAPSDQRGDLNLLASGMRQLDTVLGDYGHDFGALMGAIDNDPSLLERLNVFDSPETEQAFISVDDHVAASCGVRLS
jgi:hypothetical protein